MQARLKRIGIGVAALAGLLAAACGGEPPAPPPWSVLTENQPGALFGVWGTGDTDVWMAGSDARDGSGPLVLHWNGTTLERKLTGETSGDLFWVWGEGPVVWLIGRRGDDALILRHRRDDPRFEPIAGPPATTLYGVLPLSGAEVFAAGETRDAGGALLRFDGATFTAEPGIAPAPGAFFKVWGRAPNDIWVVGRGGRAQHRTPIGWQEVALPTQRPLFTVHGNRDLTIAVGGQLGGLIVEALDTVPVDATPAEAPQLNGVFVTDDGGAFAVGIDGAIWQRKAGAPASPANWRPIEGPPTRLDYHSVFVDPKGGVWAVGGQLTVPPFSQGLLVRGGVAR